MTKTIKQLHLEAIEEEITYHSNTEQDFIKSAEKCEGITKEIGIQFAQWIPHNAFIAEDEYHYVSLKDTKMVTAENLFKQFKKENGL